MGTFYGGTGSKNIQGAHEGLGLRFWGLRFRVWGSGLGFRTLGLGLIEGGWDRGSQAACSKEHTEKMPVMAAKGCFHGPRPGINSHCGCPFFGIPQK